MDGESMRFPPGLEEFFRIEGLIAEGGFGRVYRAQQRSLERPVALKVLAAFDDGLTDAPGRFRQEARIASALKHPHIVELLDHGIAGDVPWIAYALLPGPDLRQELVAGPLALPAALRAGHQIALALEAAHAIGVIHRDIKPENVLATGTGDLAVTDFGIARWTRDRSFATQAGILIGTPEYMAPELVQGEPAGPASDLYALGVLLFELLTGRHPFGGDSPLLVFQAHASVPPPTLTGVPAPVSRLVGELLVKDPRQRPADAGRVARQLESLLEGSGDGGPDGPSPRARQASSRMADTRRVPPTPGTRADTRPTTGRKVSRVAPAPTMILLLAVTILSATGVALRTASAPAPRVGVPAAARAMDSASAPPSPPSPVSPGDDSLDRFCRMAIEMRQEHRRRTDRRNQSEGFKLIKELVDLVESMARSGRWGPAWLDLELFGSDVLTMTVRAGASTREGSVFRRLLGRLENQLKKAGAPGPPGGVDPYMDCWVRATRALVRQIDVGKVPGHHVRLRFDAFHEVLRILTARLPGSPEHEPVVLFHLLRFKDRIIDEIDAMKKEYDLFTLGYGTDDEADRLEQARSVLETVASRGRILDRLETPARRTVALFVLRAAVVECEDRGFRPTPKFGRGLLWACRSMHGPEVGHPRWCERLGDRLDQLADLGRCSPPENPTPAPGPGPLFESLCRSLECLREHLGRGKAGR